MRRVTAVALFVAITCTAGRAQDDAAKAAKKLEGTYQVVSFTAGGKADNKKKDEVKSFVIKDGVITIATNKRDETVKFTIDPSKKPAHIDIDPGKDRPVPGIYETKETEQGLELTIAFGDGPKAERPKDFKGEGERTVVIKLLRKKEK
jgi:uncharacterized protein (TIGR03067 family)